MSDTIFTPDLFRVVHPLDDIPEPKVFHAGLGRIRMTFAARASLLALRLYLAGMVLLIGWRVLTGL